jgi:hypothetical protein
MRVGRLRRLIKPYVSTGEDLRGCWKGLDPKIVPKSTQTPGAVLRLNPCLAEEASRMKPLRG